MSNKQFLQIVQNPNNPSKADLMQAWFTAFDATPETINFYMEDGTIREAKITLLDYESCLPHLLIVGGHFVNVAGGSFQGFYRTSDRCGHITLK